MPDDIQGRIEHELRLIERLDYAPYFLTVDEVVRFARDQDILCQGRGSAANSSVCYVLGITAVDPSKHDLLFERFLSVERAEPPDIDVDFEHERREEVIQFIYRRSACRRTSPGGWPRPAGAQGGTTAWPKSPRPRASTCPTAASALRWSWPRRSRTSPATSPPMSAALSCRAGL